jgi:hypothetical protein
MSGSSRSPRAGSFPRARAERGGHAPHTSPRTLNLPRPVRVRMGSGGAPRTIDGRRIEQVRESWLVEDRWWTGRPLRRRYWEAVGAGGRNLVVFHDLCTGEWFTQMG